MSLGIHFALDSDTEARVLAAAGDDTALLRLVRELEESGTSRLTCHHERAWDPLHRCLTGGGPDDPLSAAVLGGRQLMIDARDYTVSYVDAARVREVASALAQVDEAWFRDRYFALADTAYFGPVDADDLAETWADFKDTRKFFDKATAANQAVIFTVDG